MIAGLAALILRLVPSTALATIGLVAGLSALLWAAALLLAAVPYLLYQLVSRRPIDMAVGQLETLNPTLTLLHAKTVGRAAALVASATAAGRGTLLILTAGITGPAPPHRGPSRLRVEPLSDEHPVLVVRRPQDSAPRVPDKPGRLLGRDAAVVLGLSTAVLAVVAWWVAERERAVCGTDCDGRPTSYGDALYWMASRLLGGDPDGLGVGSVFGRLVGLLVTIYGLYVLVYIVRTVLRQRFDEDLHSAATVVAAYEERRTTPGTRRRLSAGTAGIGRPSRRWRQPERSR